jgi:hypothetical protein
MRLEMLSHEPTEARDEQTLFQTLTPWSLTFATFP